MNLQRRSINSTHPTHGPPPVRFQGITSMLGRVNGQVELLKRTGSTRASTDVRVHPAHPPVFRIGADSDRTSVLFIDDQKPSENSHLACLRRSACPGSTMADRLEMRGFGW